MRTTRKHWYGHPRLPTFFLDFDLISFRADKTTAVLDEHIGQLIALLAPGGALVVNSDTSVDFEENLVSGVACCPHFEGSFLQSPGWRLRG